MKCTGSYTIGVNCTIRISRTAAQTTCCWYKTAEHVQRISGPFNDGREHGQRRSNS